MTRIALRSARGLLAVALLVAAGGASAADKTFTCTPIDVGVFPATRVHVRCSPGDGNIQWFAVRDSDSGDANRVLSLVSTAFVAKKKLTIWYDPADTSGGAWGCQVGDCRVIHGVRMF
ncbi:MAG TPA: hypothetical protein VJ724_11660 [Tahibacter sp.]|nr:hypothetical protein [Tahibacter sp.]